jgi:putative membrane protein
MMDGSDWAWGTLIMLVFWGGLAAVIVLGVRAFRGSFRTDTEDRQTPDAMTVLENRFARGEISEEEFERRRSALASTGDGRPVGRGGSAPVGEA